MNKNYQMLVYLLNARNTLKKCKEKCLMQGVCCLATMSDVRFEVRSTMCDLNSVIHFIKLLQQAILQGLNMRSRGCNPWNIF